MIIEIEVPDELVIFEGLEVKHCKGDSLTPEFNEVNYSDYYIRGLPVQFKIIHGDVTELDALAIQQELES